MEENKVVFIPDEWGFTSHVIQEINKTGLPVDEEATITASSMLSYANVEVKFHPYIVLSGDALEAFKAVLEGTATVQQLKLLRSK